MAPDLCGFTPVVWSSLDPRWVAVRDATVDKVFSDGSLAERVDQWVNQTIRYQSDVADSWSTPAETLQRGYGDCEDIALLKRAILLKSGKSEQDIIFAMVRDTISHNDHALLIVNDNGWKVLDSFNSHTLPVEKVCDYRPIEAFSGDKAWIYGERR